MQKKLTINLDDKLLKYALKYFGFNETQQDYSKLVEKVFMYYLKPQLDFNNKKSDDKIDDLLYEPDFDIDIIEQEYNFDLLSVEGKWPGSETVEELLEKINK